MSSELIKKLHELFRSGKLEEILELLAKEEAPPSTYSTLLSKFRETHQNFNQKGIITYETYSLEISRIREAISTILTNLPHNFNLSKIAKTQKSASDVPSESRNKDHKNAWETIVQPGELNPEYQDLEQSFINSPDDEVMKHPTFTDHEGQPRSTAHFKTYKQMLVEIRERMIKRRYHFSTGHLEDANAVLSILERIGERLMQTENNLKSDFQGALEQFRKEVKSFKNEISNPDFEYPDKMPAAIVNHVMPFCDEIQRFEQKFDIFAANSILDELPPPNQN